MTATSKMPSWFYNAIDAEKLIVALTEGDAASHDNLYYFPEFLTTLIRLMGQLPLWSNIMRLTYDSKVLNPTSSNVESYFKTLKRYLCKINTKTDRYRTDEFIMTHVEFLSGELKTAHSALNLGYKKTTLKKKKLHKTEEKERKTIAGIVK